MPYQPDGIDPFFIPNKDPGKHYRFIDASNPNRMKMWLRSYGDRPGYSIECGPTPEKTKALAAELGLPDAYVEVARNWICYGDLVLASLPMAEQERRRREMLQRSRSAFEDADEAYLASMEEATGGKIKGRVYSGGAEEGDDRAAFSRREGKPTVSLSSAG